MDIQHVIHENQKVPVTKGLAPKDVFPGFDPTPRTFIDEGMKIEYNHPIKLRDGVQLRADIYRPENQPENVKLPIVLVYTPFGKQTPFDISKVPTSRDFDPGYHGVIFSKYLIFEATDPAFWTKNGFAYVAVDSRGSFASEGEFFSFLTKSDGRDAYDVIEYLGERPWSNGRVGMIGASGLGHIQWHAAANRPPHLAGIMVQDAYVDFYREVVCKGGVPHMNFIELLSSMYMAQSNEQGCPRIDVVKAIEENPHDSEFWDIFRPDLDQITCPLYLITSLADKGIHTPGSIRGYLAAQSSTKYIELHPYLKWEWQLTAESQERQLAFFNKVLNGPDQKSAGAVDYWPPVRLHVTDKHYSGSWRSENEFPIARTQRTKFFLGSDENLLKDSLVGSDSATYDSKTGSVAWQHTFDKPTEITGSSLLHLSLSISEGSDADLFVTLQKINRDGEIVKFPYHSFVNDGHVAWGWLRASKRKRANNPYGDEVMHTFLEKDLQPLEPGEKVEVDINLQQTGTLFRKGETIRVVVQGRDFNEYSPNCQVPRAGTGCNVGQHTIFMEGSFVELPIVPFKYA
ncbi:hypothetical protein N7504_007679 [Penicillium tannophilum]|nr:hypothetical protein N7504_007679 [Penicillium tannophilum]